MMRATIATRSSADRLRYAVLFEVTLIALLAPIGALVFERPVSNIGSLGLVLALKAMLINLIFNWLYDRIDLRSGRVPSERSFTGRLLHAAGLEAGLVLTSLPIVTWWLEITLMQALAMDLVVSLFVVAYTFLFTLAYDRLLPVPQPVAQLGAA